MTTIHIRWSDDGRHIRKWDHAPFDGSTPYTASGDENPIVALADRIVMVRSESEGFWKSCTGCYETEDGHPVGRYDFSDAMQCPLGSGCGECGGLGAIWDDTDYSTVTDDMLRDDALEARAERGGAEATSAALEYLSGLDWLPTYVSTYVDQRRMIAIGEATLAASRTADPDAKPDGTREALATCATMLETYMPDCLPANEHGQVDFIRCMTDATVAEIRAYLANERTDHAH